MPTTTSSHIQRIEWGCLEGRRPRAAGANARLGSHGVTVRVPLLRLTTKDGLSGFGPSWIGRPDAAALLGLPLSDLFSPESGAQDRGLPVEFALWDLAGKQAGQPVAAVAASLMGKESTGPFTAPCYDTSLYFDDLDLASEAE
ncbi:MAG: mandelate racemase, partial [Armatimonadota bacterium]|nr:mandelate racemase [Armatimonadota bacterium]